MSPEIQALAAQLADAKSRVVQLLTERNATGLAIDNAILSGIVPQQHPMRSRLLMLANIRDHNNELAAELAEVTQQRDEMAELLCDIVRWSLHGHPDEWAALVERIDALLAGGEA